MTKIIFTTVRGGSRAAATSKRECFVIIVNGFQPLTIIAKCSILNVAAALDQPLPVKKHAKKFGELQISVIKGKLQLFTSLIQINHLNQYVICFMAQWIKYLVVKGRCWYLIKILLRSLEFSDLLNSWGCTFRFFCIKLTFIISNVCCTTKYYLPFLP